jgi:hypothetical protein
VHNPESQADDPAVGLCANQVVVALACSRLITREGVATAATVLARPASSCAVVFVGAEAVTALGTSRCSAGGIWQVVVGDPQISWSGQDLTERRCLLWSAANVGTSVRQNVERNMALLARWLDTTVGDREEMDRLRAGHALELARRAATEVANETGRAGGPGGAHVSAHRLRALV